MSKELDALEELRDFRYGKNKLLVCQTAMYKIIKDALQRLEKIDSAKFSDALERFDYIGNDIKFAYDDDYVSYDYTDDVEYIKNTLIKAQEQEKILKIIKEKEFDYDRFNYAIKYWQTTKEQVEVYNNGIGNRYKYTEEEFELLKAYFK